MADQYSLSSQGIQWQRWSTESRRDDYGESESSWMWPRSVRAAYTTQASPEQRMGRLNDDIIKDNVWKNIAEGTYTEYQMPHTLQMVLHHYC
ncbi:MAG: hypothetical protein ABEI52_11665 [Halobacteriaceae archaeon]